MARRSSNEVVVITWRDIPAQVKGKVGDLKHDAVLPHRFQKAVDRAAMVAGKKTYDEYITEWRRTTEPFSGDLAAAVDEIAARIEAEYTNERLMTLVANGGWDPASPEEHPDAVIDPTVDPNIEIGE